MTDRESISSSNALKEDFYSQVGTIRSYNSFLLITLRWNSYKGRESLHSPRVQCTNIVIKGLFAFRRMYALFTKAHPLFSMLLYKSGFYWWQEKFSPILPIVQVRAWSQPSICISAGLEMHTAVPNRKH